MRRKVLFHCLHANVWCHIATPVCKCLYIGGRAALYDGRSALHTWIWIWRHRRLPWWRIQPSRLIVKCLWFMLSHCFEIWQAHRQQCYRGACQISEWSDNSKYKSRGFETSQDLMIRHLTGYWNRAQGPMGGEACFLTTHPEISQDMRPANEKHLYNVTMSLIA